MINPLEIMETINMIDNEHLDIRTITMGISLLDCIGENSHLAAQRVYDKVTRLAENLVPVGEQLEKEYGIPIINIHSTIFPEDTHRSAFTVTVVPSKNFYIHFSYHCISLLD